MMFEGQKDGFPVMLSSSRRETLNVSQHFESSIATSVRGQASANGPEHLYPSLHTQQ